MSEITRPSAVELLVGKRVSMLLNRCMVHSHNTTYCYNNKKRRKEKSCRFGFQFLRVTKPKFSSCFAAESTCPVLNRVVVLTWVHMQQEGADEENKSSHSKVLPLRLAYSLTVHKSQGQSLGKIMFTPGSKKLAGTLFTALTRSRQGLEGILIVNQGEFNAATFKNNCNASRTLEK